MTLQMLQGEGIQWLFTKNKANRMPVYFDVQRYLYKPVIHTSHPGLKVNILS